MVSEVNILSHVIFAGELWDDDLVKVYNASDVLVMPSLIDSFGIVFLEANACGKPVIGMRCGGITDAVIDGVTGLIVEKGNISQLSDAIIKLLTDKEYSRCLGENGRQRVEQRFTWRHVGDEIKKVLQSAVERASGGGRP